MPRGAAPEMYITKARHFKGALSDDLAPKAAQEVAKFIFALVAAGVKAPSGQNIDSRVPCMASPRPRKFCLGILKFSRTDDPAEILWECPACGKAGTITDW